MGGSISDRKVLEKSHFKDLLDHSDFIMAAHGLEILGLIRHACCKTSTAVHSAKRQAGEDQFSKDECFETNRIANLCIHVEHAIKRVKG